MAIPTISVDAMAAIDWLLPERYVITTNRLMEAAGLRVAELVRHEYPDADRVMVTAGPGNNGGDALVAARWLHCWGRDVTVLDVDGGDGLRAEHRETAAALGLDLRAPDTDLPDADLLVDGLLGSGIDGSPRGTVAELVEQINGHAAPKVSVDVPTGLDCRDDALLEPHVEPATTVTLGLPKPGMTRERCGTIWVADIGIPPAALMAVGIDARGLFRERSLVRYDTADPDTDHSLERA